ncbi:GAF domain-containing protein [Rhodococcus oxybenzonivorans]|uniref:GAF domain-containing protein n=1 Tax=Rhodococcus oxybenzonivorans TaxID=1990687 RepID=UPI002953DEE9|nr:GAF domain-containing protein [Rhodococcus oxybenzonivorans]MDV7354691.1 GAF domain-containing protein [Rhodococcus oxybenzonivorans]
MTSTRRGASRRRTAEPAVGAGEDPAGYARILAAVYEATMSGDKSPARPREVVDDSWRRLRELGIDPESAPPTPRITPSRLDTRRRESGLVDVLDHLVHGLDAVVDGGDNILVVTDHHGVVLWRRGSSSALGRADRLGFVEGATWAEESVGTNGIGTALASRRPVQIFSAEHYVRSHHAWTCAGAPIRDPRTGRVLGVVDVSGPVGTVHPATLALVDAVARLAESHLREIHREHLDRLRAVAAPMLSRMTGPALAVDSDGWTAAIESSPFRPRLLLPDDMTQGRAWMPDLGSCDVEPLPGGWLVRPVGNSDREATPRTLVRLDLARPQHPIVHVHSAFGSWVHEPTPRHAEILFLLTRSRDGRTAAQLADDLFGDSGRAMTVRAEMSRLRRHFPGIVLGQPYRFDEAATLDVRLPEDRTRLLPHSVSPAVVAARTSL